MGVHFSLELGKEADFPHSPDDRRSRVIEKLRDRIVRDNESPRQLRRIIFHTFATSRYYSWQFNFVFNSSSRLKRFICIKGAYGLSNYFYLLVTNFTQDIPLILLRA